MYKRQLQSRWGSDYAANMQRLQSLATRTGQTVLLYNGQPAAACYHAISSGHTEASQNVWGGQLPYLCGVDSAWDKFADGYEVTIQYLSLIHICALLCVGMLCKLLYVPGGTYGCTVQQYGSLVFYFATCHELPQAIFELVRGSVSEQTLLTSLAMGCIGLCGLVAMLTTVPRSNPTKKDKAD